MKFSLFQFYTFIRFRLIF